MIRFLSLNDTHIMGITPESRKDNIKETIKNKFRQVGDYIKTLNVDFVIHAGDLFDTPDISNKLAGEISEIMREWKVPIYVIPGNHDLYAYDINTLPNTKLGVFASTGVVNILDREHPLYFPNDAGASVCIEGQEYYADIDSGKNNDYAVYSSADVKILVAHSMLLNHDFISGIHHTKIDDVVTNADMVITGHYHPGYTTTTVNGTTFINLGSILRRENTKENKNRIPSCLIVDIDNAGNISYFDQPLKVEKYEDVFKDVTAAKAYDSIINNFTSKVVQHTFKGVNVVDMIKDYSNTHPDDEKLCNVILTDISKAQIKKGVDKGFIPTAQMVELVEAEIVNFQAHEKIIIKFTSGLNVIEGSSGVGKSSILRAIYWCLNNTPNGSDFITTGHKECRVKLKMSNGYSIERKRSRSSAGEYVLIDASGNISSYKGFSNKIPIEITNAHQMPEIEINKNKYKLNIAEQLDGPFMVCNTSNDRLAIIGALVDADVLDDLKSKYTAKKINANSDLKKYERSLDTKKMELTNYSNLESIEEKVSKVEKVISQLEAIDENIQMYVSVKNDYDNLIFEEKQLKHKLNNIFIPKQADIDSFTSYIDEIDYIGNIQSEYISLINTRNSLNITMDYINSKNIDKKDIIEYEELVNGIEILENINNAYQECINKTFEFNYDIDTADKHIRNYEIKVSEIEQLSEILIKYKEYISNNKFDDELTIIEDKIDNINKQKDKVIEDLKSEDATCPYCHQKIDVDIALKEE